MIRNVIIGLAALAFVWGLSATSADAQAPKKKQGTVIQKKNPTNPNFTHTSGNAAGGGSHFRQAPQRKK